MISGYGSSSKGQFFILGAILVVLAIYLLSGTLMSGKSGDPSFVQDNEAVWIADETTRGLYRIMRDNLTDEAKIVEYIEMQREIANGYGYNLEFRFDDTFMPFPENNRDSNLYTIVVKSSDFYMERSAVSLPYEYDCVNASIVVDGCDEIDTVDIKLSYRNVCCYIYGLCC